MSVEPVEERMRRDWNARAREDAHYYVAFGRRAQSDDEFFGTASDVLRSLRVEMRRLGGPDRVGAARVLEIGCGPARLMRPLAGDCAEIHGIDVSSEMIERARRNLAGVANARLHTGSGSDLSPFGGAWFDFVYSYAVFQHIPDRAVIFNYLREAARVLKPSGILRVQVNGLAEASQPPNTWWGASIKPVELRRFAEEHGLLLLTLEGAGTQYLWVTMCKPGTPSAAVSRCEIVRVTAAMSSEPAVPARGRYAAIAMLVAGLPDRADLLSLEARFSGVAGEVVFVGPRFAGELAQVNALPPAGMPSGITQVELRWQDKAIAGPKLLRVLPPPPAVPRIAEVMDGIDIVSGRTIVSGRVKLILEEVENLTEVSGDVNGDPVSGIETFLVDPRVGRWEVNLALPASVSKGSQWLKIRVGKRTFPPVYLEVA